MTASLTLASQAPEYHPLLHDGVTAVRLQGHEASSTDRFWVGLSTYAPGGAAQLSPAAEETVYIVLDGELAVQVPDEGLDRLLRAGDSIHLPKGTIRSVNNRSHKPARLLVVIATPKES